MKKNAGFTLIELVVAIAIAALVLSGVSAVILMGLNNNRLINQAVTVQNDSRVITQLLQTLTSRGTITGISKVGEDYMIRGKDSSGNETTLLYYSQNGGTLESADGVTLMDNVEAFDAYLGQKGDEAASESQILTLSVKAGGETYERSVYCRTQTFEKNQNNVQINLESIGQAPITIATETISEKPATPGTEEDSGPNFAETEENRLEFLKLLATQYGSDGTILGMGDTYYTFTDWYSGRTWDKGTPWCAIFVSWAANLASLTSPPLINGEPPRFSWVQDGVNYFSSNGKWKSDNPEPGDYIFFNNDTDADADHVGVVLFTYVENGLTRVATIEGNTNGHVGMRTYPISSTSIVGYGVLDWNTAWTPPGGGN